ncbi:expressed protein [Echinococcus multilocularis]|uniref:Expressed protein n=1 Tax=Echinococcus multilocularis TaxID=6211 RepID=A0A068YDG5_ECHMU|nr:expressed protein [Echinococcus multilocularis]
MSDLTYKYGDGEKSPWVSEKVARFCQTRQTASSTGVALTYVMENLGLITTVGLVSVKFDLNDQAHEW